VKERAFPPLGKLSMKNKEKFWIDIGVESKAIAKAEKMIEKKEAKKFEKWERGQEKKWKKTDKNWL